MTRLTNNIGLDLSIVPWLATDEYFRDPRPNHISVTKLIKPIRQIILGARVPVEFDVQDIVDRISSSIGHVLHRGVEHGWTLHYRPSLEKMGFTKRVIDAIRLNPVTEEPDTIPVYTEFRAERIVVINGVEYILSGQIDLIIEARLRDVKSTKVWAYQNQKSVEQWTLQGSIYRWLNPEKIRHDAMVIQYLLLDWSRAGLKRDPSSYPPHAAPTRSLTLMGLQETEQYITSKLSLLQQLFDAPETDLPECSEEDLWRTEPVFKYYVSGQVTARSTKNFEGPNAELEARTFQADKGGKGLIVRKPGEVKACAYCPAFPLCTQKDRYIADGSLII